MLNQSLRRTRKRILSINKWKLRVLFWGGAITIGGVAAIFAMASFEADELFRNLHRQHPLVAYAIPPIGLAVIAWLTRRIFIGTEGSGIPQAIAALTMHSGEARSKVLSIRVAFGKILLTSGGLMSGASIGREGPTVHVGASIMYSLRHIALFRGKDMTRALILAGGAAGISAAFNTPLAGLLFAIEEMSRSYEQRSSGILIIAVVVAGITALAILGDYTYFGTSQATLTLTNGWLAVLICGTVGGLLGGIFSTSLIIGTRRIADYIKRHPVLVAFICGLIVSLLGYLSAGSTFGTGYLEAKRLVVADNHPHDANLLFPVYKYLATVASYLSGIPGGIFAPSLSIGAGMGADLAGLVPYLPFSAMVMLGMVGYFTGVVQTPITALVIVMEMTDNSSMILPLMATALIAKSVSSWVCPRPIYQALADAFTERTAKTAD